MKRPLLASAGQRPYLLRTRFYGAAIGMLALFNSAPAQAQSASYNLYGSPGLIDLPTAEMAEDAELATTVSNFGGTTRVTTSFQLLPRLTTSFRYTAARNLLIPGYTRNTYYDRSFDLRYQLLTEGKYRPAIAVGLQDFIGTGVYGSEYVVASKEIVPNLRVTGGLGWGRLGQLNPLGQTGTRPGGFLATGGVPSYDKWFRGNYAAFGGVSYTLNNNRTTLKLEYSSDRYGREERSGMFTRRSPFNFGITHALDETTQVGAYAMHGDTVGVQLTLMLNPKKSPFPGGIESAPYPVKRRAVADRRDLGWTLDSARNDNARAQLAALLAREKLVLEGLDLKATRAVLRLRNPTYGATAQAIGRAARAMSRALPGSVETFVVVPVHRGMALSAVTLQRSDIENLENAAATEMFAKTVIRDGYGIAPEADSAAITRFKWSLGPYPAMSVFDPDNPVLVNYGVRATGEYAIAPNLILSGSVTKKINGNLGTRKRPITTGLPRVRTYSSNYAREGDPAIEYLQLAAFGRPGPDLYSRVSAGYLEPMYAGVSGELLWKPVDSRLAFGAEVNLIRPRAFDQLFGFRTYNTPTGTIPKANGHVSAYYDMGNGFHGQLDVGRYLAGDYGATITVDREFSNGWKIGAYATFTDASAASFGEGSFDKGIRITTPFSWVLGTPTRRSNAIVLQSLTRDGGARLDVQERLYDRVRDYHSPEIVKTWGRFWR